MVIGHLEKDLQRPRHTILEVQGKVEPGTCWSSVQPRSDGK